MQKDPALDAPHERQRLKIISNEFGETPVLKLMFGALCASAERRRGLRFTELELRQIAAVRKDISGEYEAAIIRPARLYRNTLSNGSALSGHASTGPAENGMRNTLGAETAVLTGSSQQASLK